MTERPTPELPAFWITHSPGCRSTYSLSSSAAVGGLIDSIESCRGSAPPGSANRPAAGRTTRSRQAEWVGGTMTRSPGFKPVTARPTERMRATPSLPTPAGKDVGSNG